MQKIALLTCFILLLPRQMRGMYRYAAIDDTIKSTLANDNCKELKTYFHSFHPHYLLLLAAEKNALNCAEFLLKDKLASIDGDSFMVERNPLYVALTHDNFDFAHFLHRNKADVNTTSTCKLHVCNCKSVLDHLKSQNLDLNVYRIKWLRDHGATYNPYLRDEEKLKIEEKIQKLKIKIA
ncbi:hypothetical protein BH09DEP1_BH09DEP1_4300 [soil metagenome]